MRTTAIFYAMLRDMSTTFDVDDALRRHTDEQDHAREITALWSS